MVLGPDLHCQYKTMGAPTVSLMRCRCLSLTNRAQTMHKGIETRPSFPVSRAQTGSTSFSLPILQFLISKMALGSGPCYQDKTVRVAIAIVVVVVVVVVGGGGSSGSVGSGIVVVAAVCAGVAGRLIHSRSISKLSTLTLGGNAGLSRIPCCQTLATSYAAALPEETSVGTSSAFPRT